jgi:hypothetical protein
MKRCWRRACRCDAALAADAAVVAVHRKWNYAAMYYYSIFTESYTATPAGLDMPSCYQQCLLLR